MLLGSAAVVALGAAICVPAARVVAADKFDPFNPSASGDKKTVAVADEKAKGDEQAKSDEKKDKDEPKDNEHKPKRTRHHPTDDEDDDNDSQKTATTAPTTRKA
jgi:hypothetical protein